ncbi:MAG: sugar phosphate nucleotidyltransferase [Bacillota bacterium]
MPYLSLFLLTTMWPLKKNGLRLLQAPLTVKNFVEKPDIFTAVKLLAEGNYFWNSGMLLKSCISQSFTILFHYISIMMSTQK